MWNKSVATAPWNQTQEGDNQADWAQALINNWGEAEAFILAGSYALPIELTPAYPNTDYLINEAFNSSVKGSVKAYCTHSYALSLPNSTLPDEMNHAKTVADLSNYVEKIVNAKSVGRPYIIGEAGFHGPETAYDATFGSALQLVDKTLHALSLGVQRIFYHQGSLGVNQASFNWWSLDAVEAPFYAGYFSTLAISGGDKIIASDSGNGSYAQYVIYQEGTAHKVVLINTDYYSGDGERNETTFMLRGLESSNVKLLRMTAPSSEVKIELGQEKSLQPNIGGMTTAWP